MPDQAASRKPGPAGTRFHEIRWLASVDSTNRLVLEEARAGAAEGLVVCAGEQTAGRGRQGRTWIAPAGSSLLCSVLLRPRLPPDRRHLVVIAASVAVAGAVESTTGVATSLKWPNDVMVGEAKLAGVLAEADGDAVVVGMGVNVDWPEVPAELIGVATAANREGGRPVGLPTLLDEVLRRYDAHLDDLPGALREYRRRLGTLGRRVRVDLSDGPLTGIAADVDHAGHLLVEVESGCLVEVAAGDVVHLRSA